MTKKNTLTVDRQVEIEAIKEVLIAQRDQLKRTVTAKLRGRRQQADRSADSLDLALDNASSEMDAEILQANSKTLNAVEAAIARIDAGIYGNCSDCGNPISPIRLHARPFAVRCNDCAVIAEESEIRQRESIRDIRR